MIHIAHDHINRTLCGLKTYSPSDPPRITQRQYFRRRAVEHERLKVCGRCARAAQGNTVTLRR